MTITVCAGFAVGALANVAQQQRYKSFLILLLLAYAMACLHCSLSVALTSVDPQTYSCIHLHLPLLNMYSQSSLSIACGSW